MKLRWILFLLIGMGLSLCSPSVHAQGFPIENVVWNQNGFPVSGASITVCAGQYAGTPPCTSPATIYSDLALTQPIPNPITTGSLGDYRFVVAAGVYTVSITASGAGLTPTNHIIVVPFGSGSDAAIKPAASDAIEYVSPANGNDSNDCFSLGSACKTLAQAILVATTAGVVPHVKISAGTLTPTATIQLPVNTFKANCIIEGSSSSGGQGTGSGTLSDQGMTLIQPASGTFTVFDQTFTNSSFQNALGCQLRHLAIDGENMGAGAIGVKFGGTTGFTLDDVSVSNFSGTGSAGVEGINSAASVFTEQWNFPLLRISNDTTGILFTRTASNSTDFGHGFANIIWNEFASQTGLSLADGTTYDSYFINNGNFTGTSCSGIKTSAASSTGSGGNMFVYWGAENDGSCTRFNNSAGGTFDVTLVGSGTSWGADTGTVTLEGNSAGVWNFPSMKLLSTGGGSITHQAPNTASNFTITDPAFATTLTGTVASGTATMTTGAIGSGACGTTVTVSATGTLTTDTITYAFNAAVAANPGELTLRFWPTTGNVNFEYCNPTAGSITPTAATLNWRVVR